MRTLPLALILLTGCADPVGRQPDGTCARLALPDLIEVADVRFGEQGRAPLTLAHDCRRKPSTIEIDTYSLQDMDHWSFRSPPFRQVQPEQERAVGMLFTPRWPTYRYESTLTIRAMGETYEVPLVGTADPDQDDDGVEAEQAGGSDCNDLDPAVQTATEEVDDGIDNDCDGIVDEPFIELGSVRITEILTQPDAARAEFGIWVELQNIADRSINVRGWRIEHDRGRLQVRGDVIIEPGQRAVIGVEGDPTLNGGLAVDGLMVGDLLPDEPTRVALESDGLHSEALFTRWPGKWATAAALDPRAALAADRTTEDDAWCAALDRQVGMVRGTPGAENRMCRGLDFDGDGYSAEDGDCDDNRADVRPGGTELWNDLDDNCDDWVDMMWIEDRLEDELIEVGQATGIAVGRLGGDARDGVAILLDDELAIVRPSDPWAGREASRAASHSLELDTLRGAVLLSETVELGGGWEIAALGAPRTPAAQIVLLDPPTSRRAPESDHVRMRMGMPASAFGHPGGLSGADLDGDGTDELVYLRDGVRAVDLPFSVTGEVEEADVLETAWLASDGGVRATGIRTTDQDLDGYEDLIVRTWSAAGSEHRILRGDTSLGTSRSLADDADLILPSTSADHIDFMDVHGDGQADLVQASGNTVQVWPGPLSLPLGAPATILEARPAHRLLQLTSLDVDGDAFVERVAVSDNGAAPRAWFLDDGGLRGSGTVALGDAAASQWGPVRGSWVALPGIDRDGDGRDSLLFWSFTQERGVFLQQVPARP